MNFRAKSIIKKVALILAGITAVTAAGFGVKAIVDYTKDDLKTITPTFEVGNLGSDGKYVADESTLYTKEAFGCYGLQVKPDFDAMVEYQIYYYDILDNYVSSSSVLDNGYSAEAPINGAYARLVIIPKDDEDGKISLLEKVQYPSQLTVKVKKNQDINNRFNVFRGKVMQVVNDTDSLVFENNCYLDPETLLWEGYSSFCVTSTTLLKVEPASTFTFDFSSITTTYNDAIVRLYQFKDIPLEENYISSDELRSTESSLVLNSKTKYIIISLYSGSSDVEFDTTTVSNIKNYISVTKK